MNKIISNYIQAHKQEILDQWIDRTKEEADDRVIRLVSDRVFQSTSKEFIDLIISNFKGTSEEYNERLTDFAEKVVRLGWPLTFVTKGLHTFNLIVFEGMQKEGVVTQENQMEIVYEFDRWATPMNNEIVSVYSSTWERTVSLQKIALQELSAPLIPVFEGITVMPLVGTIDTERAKQIMENLLKGAVKHRSEVVLIDITGVPVVDTMVAHHIIQAADAVRLIGAKCMLVGIRPEIAQTIVNLGIDLNQFTTKNNLKKGIEAALELTNKKIVSLEGAK
ncbi:MULTISPECIES: RsbT co-antagonist protein RsbRA [Bacillaceae]|jgi:rsbT co-antagonist protein RsbR|uniref:RsbR, positive regulator of sigma-B n=1 Tax=Mesobacillus selenatarsenatis (strain DSM 18680 / JCM 14380 / FERM P-15431 / SF-1) TaxID=1321606 RepID=A0A0A8XAV7_MESS1|nr:MULTISPECIES: RsbT co-antagonist protein RsbRA [Bacillaceae]MBT2685650.1 STAS domain-containing protein [Bacillus sp. ISL-37]GAM16172.1 RsbR, positive regulator of sigma-B [Mesobacillus selenatarsenatis SF-1]